MHRCSLRKRSLVSELVHHQEGQLAGEAGTARGLFGLSSTFTADSSNRAETA